MSLSQPSWSEAQHALWRRIEAHDFEPAGHVLTFAGRLAREQGWSEHEARRAIDEYRRFCFLAGDSTVPVVPSEAVDEVWHLHLTYTRDYWGRWCKEVLRTDLHHDPTTGGPQEKDRFAALYARTLARYEANFGPPDAVLWPGVAERFGLERPAGLTKRVRKLTAGAIAAVRRWPRPLLGAPLTLLLVVAAWPGLAFALGLNPLDWPAQPFLTLYLGLSAAALGLSWAVRSVLRRQCAGADASNLTSVQLGFLAAGPTRAAETVMVGMAQAGALTRAESGRERMALEPAGVTLHPDVAPFRNATQGVKSRSEILGQIAPDMEQVRAQLVERALTMSPRARGIVEGATMLFVCPVVLLGLSKMAVGLSRGKPIGFLVVMTIALVVLAVLIATKACRRTQAGDEALAVYRARHSREMRAPVEGEAILGFALAGAVALAGTPLATYVAQPAGSSGSDSGSSDGGSGCGGGGGCGGCGGGGGD